MWKILTKTRNRERDDPLLTICALLIEWLGSWGIIRLSFHHPFQELSILNERKTKTTGTYICVHCVFLWAERCLIIYLWTVLITPQKNDNFFLKRLFLYFFIPLSFFVLLLHEVTTTYMNWILYIYSNSGGSVLSDAMLLIHLLSH